MRQRYQRRQLVRLRHRQQRRERERALGHCGVGRRRHIAGRGPPDVEALRGGEQHLPGQYRRRHHARPIHPRREEPTGVIHDSFATVTGNVCADNTGAGIQTIHAGYVAVHGNVCDGKLSSGKDSESAGIAIVSSRHTLAGGNVLIANKYGVALLGRPRHCAAQHTGDGPPPPWRQRLRRERRGDSHRRTPPADPATARATGRR